MSHYTRLRDLANNTDNNINLDTGDRLTRRDDQTVAVYDKVITSTGGGSDQLSLAGATAGATGLLYFQFGTAPSNTNNTGNYSLIRNGTAYDVTPGKTYRFFDGSVNLYNNSVILALRPTMNSVAEMSSLVVFPYQTTKIYDCQGVGTAGQLYIYAYIYQGKLQIFLAEPSSSFNNVSHTGWFTVIES